MPTRRTPRNAAKLERQDRMRERWAEYVRQFRAQNQLSQNDLAYDLQVSLNTVQNWEAAQVVPDTFTLITFLERFGVDCLLILAEVGCSPQNLDDLGFLIAETVAGRREWRRAS